MKINICIIENEIEHLNSLVATLHQWENANSVYLDITTFQSGSSILKNENPDYHIIFLDIQLSGKTGIEIAQILRSNNYKGEIVFLTAYHEYVFEGYNVHALNYFLKPISYQQVDYCLQYIINNFPNLDFIYRYHNKIIKIPYNDILYFSSSNQYTEIHTFSSSYKQAEALKNILKYLPQQFIQCHRTTIININYIDKLVGKNVYLTNGTILPISNTHLNNIRNAFLLHISGKI